MPSTTPSRCWSSSVFVTSGVGSRRAVLRAAFRRAGTVRGTAQTNRLASANREFTAEAWIRWTGDRKNQELFGTYLTGDDSPASGWDVMLWREGDGPFVMAAAVRRIGIAGKRRQLSHRRSGQRRLAPRGGGRGPSAPVGRVCRREAGAAGCVDRGRRRGARQPAIGGDSSARHRRSPGNGPGLPAVFAGAIRRGLRSPGRISICEGCRHGRVVGFQLTTSQRRGGRLRPRTPRDAGRRALGTRGSGTRRHDGGTASGRQPSPAPAVPSRPPVGRPSKKTDVVAPRPEVAKTPVGRAHRKVPQKLPEPAAPEPEYPVVPEMHEPKPKPQRRNRHDARPCPTKRGKPRLVPTSRPC